MNYLELLRAKQATLNADLNSRQPGTQAYEDRLAELQKVVDAIRSEERAAEEVINAGNVADEPYYNLVQLCRLTRYADPLSAIQSTGKSYRVTRDECGNILTAEEIAA